MLYGVVLMIHIAVSLVLVGVVLIQGGRGGLSETLSGSAAQSLFGSSTVTVLTRLTTLCASVFVVTCLSLAYLSTARGRSVVDQIPTEIPASLPILPSGELPFDVGSPVPPTPATHPQAGGTPAPAAQPPRDANSAQ